MRNIFEGAKYGDKFLLEDGTEAIFIGQMAFDGVADLIVARPQCGAQVIMYNEDGTPYSTSESHGNVTRCIWQPRWHTASEEPERGWYLTCDERHCYHVDHFINDRWAYHPDEYHNKVTYWMELPPEPDAE